MVFLQGNKMRSIPTYDFHKTKYGSELLIDVVDLKYVKNYLPADSLHTLTYYDITLITEGEGFFGIEGLRPYAKERDVIFSLPYQIREWDTENIRDGYALIFEEEFLLSFFNDPHFLQSISYFRKNRKNSKLALSAQEFQRMKGMMLQIQYEIVAYTVKNKHMLRALLYQALMELDRIFIEQHRISEKYDRNTHVDSFLKRVDTDFLKSHDVRYYAEKLYLTPNYLNELVKREIGISAKQAIRNRLLAESKKLLLYSSLPVGEIAERLSFETPSYFIRFFRKHVGCTPLQFRKGEKP